MLKRNLTVLILEDEVLISMDLEAGLAEAGFTTTAVRSCKEAAVYLADNRPDFAVLDVRLSDGECIVAATRLVEQNVPFIVHTGLLKEALDSVFSWGTIVCKPAGTPTIVELVSSQLSRISVI